MGAIALLLLTSLLLSTATAYNLRSWIPPARYEVPDEEYLSGHLAWKSGTGSIVWSANADTDDPAGPSRDPAADQMQYLNVQTQSSLGPPPAPVEFVSAPLQRTLHLNASRFIQVNLYIVVPSDGSTSSTAPCTTGGWYTSSNVQAPRVALYEGDRLVGGADTTANLNMWPDTKFFKPDPAGYALCRYRIAVEVPILEAGSVLRLVVSPTVDSYRHYQYGMKDDHASNIFLPFYSEQEILYRYPSETPAASASLGEETPTSVEGTDAVRGAATATGVLGLAGLALGRRSRRRALALVLVLALLSTGLSGCLKIAADSGEEGNDTQPTGDAKSVIQPANGSNLASGGLGAIVGLVSDDMRIPINGVHIAILGTSNSTTSDGAGRFQFKNVRPGLHTLRFDHADHHSLETRVKVEPDSLTRVDITLIPLVISGERSHFHDYWGGETSAKVFDEALGQQCTQQSCVPRTAFRLPAPELGSPPNSIRPGTYETEVTITWDAAAMGVDKVGLIVHANHDANPNGTAYAMRSSPATFHVVTTWEMTDAGHQPFSSWAFDIYALGSDGQVGLYDPEYAPHFVSQSTKTGVPEFKASIVLHKGTVPLERAHPDLWQGASELQIDRHANAGPSSQTVIIADALFGLGFVSYCATQGWLNYAWVPETVVPVGTTSLQVVVKQTRATGIAGTVGHYDWNLEFKPGNEPAAPFTFPTADRAEPNPVYTKAPTPERAEGDTKYVWTIPVAAGESDSFYARKSNWQFAMYPTDQKQACIDTQSYAASNPLASSVLSHTVTITAYRD